MGLEWPAPVLDAPTTVAVPPTGGGANGARHFWQLQAGTLSGWWLCLANDRDWIVRLPAVQRREALSIKGGRNVTVVAGDITTARNTTDDRERRCLHVQTYGPVDGWANPPAPGRVVHIEGVRCSGDGGGSADGFSVAAPEAIVQVQRCRADGLRGTYTSPGPTGVGTTHADVIQAWGGCQELRIADLSGGSNMAGLQVRSDLAANGPIRLRRVNVWQERDTSGDFPPAHKGGAEDYYLAAFAPGDTVELRDVYVAPLDGHGTIATRVCPDIVPGGWEWPNWPDHADPTAAGYGYVSRIDRYGHLAFPGNRTGGPTNPRITGTIRPGRPPGGDWCPVGAAGLGYDGRWKRRRRPVNAAQGD